MMNKKSLSKRYQTSYETKGSNGGSKSNVFDYKKVDGEITFFKPQEGKNRINIIPYVIKTKNHPLVRRGEFDIGDSDYVMDYFTHRNIGPSEATVLCLKNTYGKPCPICEQSALLYKQGKEEEAKELKASRRVVYNIEDLKEPGKLKVFETSHVLFEKELIDEARDDEDGGFIDFADPEDGREIKFRATEVQKGKMKFKEFKSFSFEKRDEPISDELLESAISFDEIMNVPTYEEVQKILYGTDSDDEEAEKKREEFYGDDEEEEKPKKSKHHDEDDEDDEEKPKSKHHDDEDEEDERPAKKHHEEDEDDEPKKSSSKKSFDDMDDVEEKHCDKNCGDCPFNHKFGKDVDKFDDCDDCDKWDKCRKAKMAMKKEED